MKKIVSLILSAALFSATVVSAATYNTKADILGALGLTTEQQAAIDTNFEQKVNADITVRKSGENNFVDGPIEVKKSSSQAYPKFDFKASFDMKPVWQYMYDFISKGKTWLIGGNPTAEADLKAVPVTGAFTIKITYPDNLDIPDSFRYGEDMFGFTDNAKASFVETAARSVSETVNSKTLTISVALKDAMTCGQLVDLYNPAIESKSQAFELLCSGVQPAAYGTYTVKGEVTGNVTIGSTIATVAYNAVQKGTDSNENLSATVEITKKSETTVGGNTGGGVYIPPTGTQQVKVEFDVNGDKTLVAPLVGTTAVAVDYENTAAPAVEGLTFDGWYLDPGFTTKLTGKQTVVANLVVYGRYIITEAPAVFDDAHKAYIKGYPDGTVQPKGLITREEITTALYRLLKDSVVQDITTTENSYSDVAADRWSNTSISSMTKGGYIKGYEDGSFRPANDITRAEFATLVLRFFSNANAIEGSASFIDTDDHWAEENIIKAHAMGLFNGYEDGSFKPDAYITRAEAMAVINRITVRRANNNSFTGNYINWPDISTSDWYYADVIEATNTHDFIRIDDVMTESWTDVSYTELIVG